MPSKLARISFRMDDKVVEHAENIVNKLGLGNKSEAVGFAIGVTSTLSDYLADGGKLFVRKGDRMIPVCIHGMKG